MQYVNDSRFNFHPGPAVQHGGALASKREPTDPKGTQAVKSGLRRRTKDSKRFKTVNRKAIQDSQSVGAFCLSLCGCILVFRSVDRGKPDSDYMQGWIMISK